VIPHREIAPHANQGPGEQEGCSDSVLQRRPSVIGPGGLEGGGGFFNVLVSKNNRNLYGIRIPTFNPVEWVFIPQKQQKRSTSASLFASSAVFCFRFLLFYLFLHTSLFTILLEGFYLIAPRFEKACS